MSGPDTVVLELRVHGVRGTPAASMLGVEANKVEQVAGDRLTGFFRIAGGTQPPLRSLPPTMALEAYSWGALTSGVRGVWGWITRALWLALLPFALVNLAFWARTQTGRDSGQARWGIRAVRLSALLLTVIAVLSPCFVAIDMVGWQCFRANAVACPVLPDWLEPIAALSAGQRLALTSLVPLAALLVLVSLSFQSLARYEAVLSDGPTPDGADTESGSGILGHPLMWRGEHRTRRLQRLHVTAALSTVVAYTGVHLLVRGDVGRMWPTTAAAVVLVVFAMVRSMVVDELDLEFRDAPRLMVLGRVVTPPTGPGRWMRAVPLTAVASCALLVVALHLMVLWTVEVPPDVQDATWFGSNLWFIGLFVVLTILHVVVFVGGRARLWVTASVVAALLALTVIGGWVLLSDRLGARAALWLTIAVLFAWLMLLVFQAGQTRKPENRELAWGGAGASVLLGAATMVALLYTSAATVVSADYLNGSTQSVADLITVRNERSPVSAQGERVLTLSGDVVLDGARVVLDDEGLIVTGGTVRTEALTRATEAIASYSLASTFVDRARLVLGPDIASVRLVASCFGRADDPSYAATDACTGESKGFRTAGTLSVPESGLRVIAAHGRIELAVADPPQTPLVVPQVLVWTPLMQLAVIVVSALVLAFMMLTFRRRSAPAIRALVDQDRPEVPAQDRGRVGDARVAAALAHRGERLLDGLGVVTSALAVATLALSAAGRPPWAIVAALRPIATVSLYAAVLVCLGLMFLGSRIRRSATARRNAGILWDITTFWPRAAHPFAPPCYAERVVPEITARVGWALGDDPRAVVVLSGHSQGSLICAAVACRFRGRESRLRLLTYGSQIRAIYGRVFPAAAGPDQFGYVRTAGARRMSDPWPDVPHTDPEPHR